MVSVSIKDLLDAGVHFGHQTQRWNPKMKPFIFGERNGIYIIDLQQTHKRFQKALEYIYEITSNGQKVLFVGTKKQAQDIIEQAARSCNMFFVTNRWLGGTLTNFKTLKSSIDKLLDLEKVQGSDLAKRRTKKELLMLEKERVKLERSLGGIKTMKKPPKAVFVIDPKKEKIAVAEARKLGIPVIAITDTNCDPDNIDYVIPGNDDAIKSIKLFADTVKEACLQGELKNQERLREEQKRREEAQKKDAKEKKAPKDKPSDGKVVRKPRKKAKTEKKAAGEEIDEKNADSVSATPDGEITVRS